MAKADYYETLGVDRGADDKALKSAFRKKAMEYHPDRNGGDSEAEVRFKEINEAYDVLKDPQKRAAYDQYGHAAFENGGMGNGGFGGGGFDAGAFSDIFDDLFGDMMGGRGRGGRSGARRGNDVRYDLDVTLEEAFEGISKTISVHSAVACDTCHGTGAKEGSTPETCGTCRGVGKVRSQQGFFMVERTCPACQGAGQVISDPCKSCRGRGAVNKERSLKVSIPKGVESGTRIRLAGEGEAGSLGGPTGDLYIFITVAPHRIFQRDRENLYIQVPLPMATAILGGSIEVPVIGGGRASVKIPQGTQTGKQFRLRGKGMPTISGGPHGDMIVRANVETPSRLTKRQKELIREFSDIEAAEKGASSPESTSFFDRLREFWDELK
ncbi:MAG: molecular chaperone DnaJ [Sphingomonadales bacterium]|jgi:molecular chaperone DnaJ